jgi:hypothetical protein
MRSVQASVIALVLTPTSRRLRRPLAKNAIPIAFFGLNQKSPTSKVRLRKFIIILEGE